MRINKLLALLSFVFLLSCSSDWDILSQSEDLVITVATQQEMKSRSGAVPAVEGYEFRCIMQLLDKDGNTVGKQDVAAVTGSGFSFTVKGTDIDAGATKALFWAEYQPTASDAEKIYETSDLKNVTYRKTELDLSDASLMASMEVFSGSIAEIKAGASVTLKRPVSRISFSPTNKEAAGNVTSIEVSYITESNYNVVTDNSGESQNIVLRSANFAGSEEWFVTYILCPANKSHISGPIKVKYGDREFEIPADKIPLDPNYRYNVTGTLGSSDVTIGVEIDDSWTSKDDGGEGNEDPGKTPGDDNNPGDNTGDQTQGNTNYQIGSLIDANGYVTTDASKAVAVYFKDGAILNDAPVNYAGYEDKSIRGYAVAIENISSEPQNAAMLSNIVNYEPLSSPTGYVTTNKLIQYLGESDFVKSYNAWIELHVISNDYVTGWYIPAEQQEESMKTACNEGHVTLNGLLMADETTYILSKTNANKKFQYVNLKNNGSYGLTISKKDYSGGMPVYCRPMVTIFEEASE